MNQRTSIVRNRSKVSKSRLHDLLMSGWSRMIARHGKGAFADALDASTVAIDKHLTGSMPGFELIVDALTFEDSDVLDDVFAELGVRIVAADTVCCTDDLSLLIARVLVKVHEAEHPDGPGGRAVVPQEYLDAEQLMAQLHRATGAWMEKCREIRHPRPRSVAA